MMGRLVLVCLVCTSSGAAAADLTLHILSRDNGTGVEGVGVSVMRLRSDGSETADVDYIGETDASGVLLVPNVSPPMKLLFKRPPYVGAIREQSFIDPPIPPDLTLRVDTEDQPDQQFLDRSQGSDRWPPYVQDDSYTYGFPGGQGYFSPPMSICDCPPPPACGCAPFTAPEPLIPIDDCGGFASNEPFAGQPSWYVQPNEGAAAEINSPPKLPTGGSVPSTAIPADEVEQKIPSVVRRSRLNPTGPPAYRIYGDWVPACERQNGSLANEGPHSKQ